MNGKMNALRFMVGCKHVTYVGVVYAVTTHHHHHQCCSMLCYAAQAKPTGCLLSEGSLLPESAVSPSAW